MPWPLPETVTASTPNHPGDSALVNRFLNTFDHDTDPADRFVWVHNADGSWVPRLLTPADVDASGLGAAEGDLIVVGPDGALTSKSSGTYRAAYEGVRATRTSAQSIPNAAETSVIWNGEDWDDNSYHDLVSNPERITIPADGRYRVHAHVMFASNSSGRRIGSLFKNGTTRLGRDENGVSSAVDTVQVSGDFLFSAGDYLTFGVYQNTGGALDVDTSYGSLYITVERLAGN